MAKRDYYEVLGVSRQATVDEIRSAYRRLARKFHPDLNPGNAQAEQNFKEIGEAYEVLADPEKRKVYDQFGAEGLRAGAAAGGAPGGGPGGGYRYTWSGEGSPFEDVSFEAFGGGRPGEGGVSFEDLFEQLAGARGRGGRRGRRPARRGQDVESELELDFDQAAHGVRTTLTLQRPAADGSVKPQHIEVRIPPGVDDGQRIRLAGQGGEGAGGPPGDLYLVIRVRPHPYFRREGRDVYLDLPLSVTEAALGAAIEVPTLHGRSTLHVPAGTASGTRLRLRGQGIPEPRGANRGDQYCIIKIVPPKQPSERQQKLFEELRGLETDSPRAATAWNDRRAKP
jgi:DnaJ-class molecular chaperone